MEITALDLAYGSDSRTISIGSIKSNLGHAEGASAMGSIIKCLLMYELGLFLPNIHFDQSNLIHEPLRNGRFRVITETEPFDTSARIAVNNFGFGGVNAHVVLENGGISFSQSNRKKLYVYGRTENNVIAELAAARATDFYLLHSDDSEKYPYRGILSVSGAGDEQPLVNKVADASRRPVVFVYSGQGSQHKYMAKSLYNNNRTFQRTIQRLSAFLSEISSKEIDLVSLFTNGDEWESKCFSSIGITAVQLGLTNMLTEHGVKPDNIIGHSMGEIACAYADDCMTEAQCIHVAYIRSKLVALLDPETNIFIYSSPIENGTTEGHYELINQYDGRYTYRVRKQYSDSFELEHGDYIRKFDNQGAMLFVSMLEAKAQEVISSLSCSDTVIACYNSLDGLTLSGPKPEIMKISKYCEENSVFHRAVETGGIAYHSPLLSPYELYLIEQLEKVIPPGTAKTRSSKWLSTSARDNVLCDAAYHTSNIVGSVFFYQAVQKLPSEEYNLVVEVGPHNGLIGQVKRTRPDVQVLLYCMSQKEPKSEETFEKLIDSLWLQGCKVIPDLTLEPSLSERLPVNERYRVPWDHEETWKIVTYKDFEGGKHSAAVNRKISYDLTADYSFLLDHIIQGHSLFPAMGHIYTMWQVAGLKRDIIVNNFQIFRAINIETATSVEFEVTYDTHDTHLIQVFFADEVVAQAFVEVKEFAAVSAGLDGSVLDSEIPTDYVSSKDIYSEFDRYDYNYVDSFRVIEKQSIDGLVSKLKSSSSWMHWINYLDGLLQCSIGVGGVTNLKLPTRIHQLQLKSSDVFPELAFYVHKRPFDKKRIISDVAIISNLEVTPAPIATLASERGSIVRNIRFVPYGLNMKQSNAIDRYQKLFIEFCHKELRKMLTSDVLKKYPHLANLARYCKKTENDPVSEISSDDDAYFHQPVFSITKDIYTEADLFVNPLLTLSQHPLHNDLYLKDILFSSSLEDLQTCVDIIHENVGLQYNFLEVGTGSGGALRRVFPLVEGFIGSYTASDISVINLDENMTSVKSLRWDVNKAFPTEFNVQKFDVIFGSNSIHCAKDMLQSLQHIYNALTDNGFLLLEEYISELPIYLWGLDSFIWETAECERDHGLWMSHERWMGLFQKAKLDLVISFNNNATCLYLLRKQSQPDLQPVVVSMANLIEDLSSSEKPVRTEGDSLIVVGHNDGVLGFVKSYRKEPEVPSLIAGYLFYSDSKEAMTCQRVPSPSELPGEHLRLVTNVLKNGLHGSFRESSNFSLRPADNWTMHIEKPGFLNTLFYEEAPSPKDDSGVDVLIVGLNFKDVMLTYGKLKLDSPITLGIEFSGIWKDGKGSDKRVMGIGMNCLSKRVAKTPLLWELPESLTLEDAATIPCVYATVLYCLDHCAKIQAGQSILIHAGAGGIGQAAINVCLKRGCKVFTTCSQSKRQFLVDKFGLKENHIGSSRDPSFKDWLLEQTDNNGVDVVLNSLSEEMLLKSLDCVAPFGHFCEIGKYDIMSDNKVGLKAFERNVTFHCVDISEMIYHPRFSGLLTELVQRGLDRNEVMPIHVDSIFPHRKLGDALRYMGSGSHMGKILIDMREDSASNSAIAVSVRSKYATSGAHVVGGGLGGFGLELADWLLECGARKVFLLSRAKAVKNGYQARKILNSKGKIVVFQCDLTQEADVSSSLREIASFGEPIVGIWHLSMVLKDALYGNMTREQWDTCVDAKKRAAELLDKYSRVYAPQLQDFVMFSSISSLYGNGGQTNYAYGNACMEVLGGRRRTEGLPATVICWGRIGNVG